MTTDEIIDALLQQKQALEEHLPSLLSRCQSDAERNALKGCYQHALEQWNEAANKTLQVNDALLCSLTGELNDVREEVNAMIARGDNLAAVLSKVAAGVGIGAKILSLLK